MGGAEVQLADKRWFHVTVTVSFSLLLALGQLGGLVRRTLFVLAILFIILQKYSTK